jgi:hypothetical protein
MLQEYDYIYYRDVAPGDRLCDRIADMRSTLGGAVITMSFGASYAAERGGVDLIQRQVLLSDRRSFLWRGCAGGDFHATNIVGAVDSRSARQFGR